MILASTLIIEGKNIDKIEREKTENQQIYTMGRRNRKRQPKGKDKRGPLETIRSAIKLTE
jgi:hypothetical protein